MGLNVTTKKVVDTTIPLLGAGFVAWLLFSRKISWPYIIAGTIGAWLILYLITRSVSNNLLASGPAAIPTGGGCDSYDPQALVDSIYKDTTAWFPTGSETIYANVLSLSDCQLISAYNYWNAKYYTQAGASMPVQIAAQTSLFDPAFVQQQADLAARFKTLNLQ